MNDDVQSVLIYICACCVNEVVTSHTIFKCKKFHITTCTMECLQITEISVVPCTADSLSFHTPFHRSVSCLQMTEVNLNIFEPHFIRGQRIYILVIMKLVVFGSEDSIRYIYVRFGRILRNT